MGKSFTQAEWIETLRGAKGTRFFHQGRSRGANGRLDCIGLIITSADELQENKIPTEVNDYGHAPETNLFMSWCRKLWIERPCNRLLPIEKQAAIGDILVFWIEQENIPRHMAVYTGKDKSGRDMMIHSFAREGRGVVETPIDPAFWVIRLHSIWRHPDMLVESN